MKRFAWVAFMVPLLIFDVAACKKAHDAGNDSMRAPGGAITAAADQSGTGRPTPGVSASFADARDVAASGSSQ